MSLRPHLPVLLSVAAAAAAGPSGQPARRPSPSQTPTYQAVSVGASHTCAVTTSGEAFCWGSNLYGELGSAAAAERCSLYHGSRTVYPCSSTPLSASGGLTFQSVSAGADYTCGLATDGAAYCWGRNDIGQLGGGPTTERCRVEDSSVPCSAVPVAVAGGLTFRSVDAGCGVTTGDLTYCWGGAGGADTLPGAGPVPVSRRLIFRVVSVGDTHACGLTPRGEAYCWGRDEYGQLGTGSFDTLPHPSPLRVAGAHRFASLSAGANYTCGLTTGGVGYCWGINLLGRQRCTYEIPRTACATTPMRLPGALAFRSVSAGDAYACGVTAGAVALCWGENDSGQLGLGSDSTDRSTTPERVRAALSFRSVSAGRYHTCALTADGVAYCWGRNSNGQLGSGSMTRSATPVRVSDPR